MLNYLLSLQVHSLWAVDITVQLKAVSSHPSETAFLGGS